MPDNRGHLLPVYVLADESYSMKPYAGQLNSGMLSLCEALRSEPMVAAKVRLSVLGFSDKVVVRMARADMRSAEDLPRLQIRGGTNYHAAFSDLLKRIPQDINVLKGDGYQVHRPAVFFLSDGQPDRSSWERPHRKLTDQAQNRVGPQHYRLRHRGHRGENHRAGRHPTRFRVRLGARCEHRRCHCQVLHRTDS